MLDMEVLADIAELAVLALLHDFCRAAEVSLQPVVWGCSCV